MSQVVQEIYLETCMRLQRMAEEYRAQKDPFDTRIRGLLEKLRTQTDEGIATQVAADVVRKFEMHILALWAKSNKKRRGKIVLGPYNPFEEDAQAPPKPEEDE